MGIRVILTILGLLLVLLLGLTLLLLAWSPGKITPYRDGNGNPLPGSVAEITRIKIGGQEQGMIIKGRDDRNPVLLFLHGGPGNPEYVLAKDYPIGLEDHFTVCWWDQRVSGMSYDSSADLDSVTLEQMISDTVEVTDYLRERFGQEKIYLMGHSWGTFLGINTAGRHPELYEAYIGISQVTNQFESERLAYAKMTDYAASTGNTKLAEKLADHPLNSPSDVTMNYLVLRSSTLNAMGNGVFHEPKSTFKDLLLPVLQAREYTLSDKYGFLMGSADSLKTPANASQFTADLSQSLARLELPVYLLHGTHDYQVSCVLAQQYFEVLNAPEKHFYRFENSSHSPFMEEPETFIKIIREEVLNLR